jgi:hypothetical protein
MVLKSKIDIGSGKEVADADDGIEFIFFVKGKSYIYLQSTYQEMVLVKLKININSGRGHQSQAKTL